MSRSPFAATVLCAAALSLAEPSASIDPLVLEQAGSGKPVQIVVVLRSQPQENIIRTTRAIHQPGIDAARAEIAAAAQSSVVDESRVAMAHARADTVEVRVRQMLGQQIKAVIAGDQALVRARIEGLGGTVTRTYTILNALAATVPGAAVKTIAEHPAVLRIRADIPLKPRLDISTQLVGAPAFWGVGLTGAGVSIGLIDTGVARGARYLSGAKIIDGPVFLPSNWPPYNDDPTSPVDRALHGTFVAGVLAAQPLPGYPRHVGVARGVTIYNLKAAGMLEQRADLFPSAMMAALEYGILNTPASIFNVSFSGYSEQIYELDAIMADWNVIVVFAGSSGPYNGLAVTAINDHNTVSRSDDTLDLNNWRPPGELTKPDLAAPGVNVNIPSWQGSFDYINDTAGASVAAPHVSGGLALLQQSGIADMQVAKAILINSAFGETWTPSYGWGYLDLEKAKIPGSYFTGSADMYRSRYFAGPPDSGAFRATLVAKVRHGNWDRLGLFIIDRDTGNGVAGSAVWGQNVQRVSAPNGHYVVRVSGLNNPTDFALALTRRGFQPMTIARVDLRCSGPSTARLGSIVNVQCTAVNSGDLEAHEVKAWVGGSVSDCTLDFGKVAGHGSRTRSCYVQAVRAGSGGSGGQLNNYNCYEAWDVLDPPGGSGFPMVVSATRSGLRGIVRDAAQKPVASVSVRLSGPAIRVTTTNISGEFFFSDLQPGSGPYTIIPTRSGWSFSPAIANVTAPADVIWPVGFVGTVGP